MFFLGRPRLNRRSARVRRTPRRAFDDDDLGPGNDGAMPPPDPGGVVRGESASTRPFPSGEWHAKQRSAPGCGFAVVVERADRSRGRERFRRSWMRSPRSWSNPSPGLAPAAAANTVVFTGGIKVLLKGLTWPGVINSWFLGTVRGDDAPFASLLFPASPVDRTSDPPRAFPARARGT